MEIDKAKDLMERLRSLFYKRTNLKSILSDLEACKYIDVTIIGTQSSRVVDRAEKNHWIVKCLIEGAKKEIEQIEESIRNVEC